MADNLGDGIDRLPSGRNRARYRDADGVQRSKSFTKLKDAQKWLRAQRVAVDQGIVERKPDTTTVFQLAFKYNEGRHHRALSQRQAEQYLRHLKESPLGRRYVTAARPSDIQSYVSFLSKTQKLSARTTRNHVAWVRRVFIVAVDDDIIVKSPVRSTLALPPITAPKIKPLTREQIDAWVEAMPERYAFAITLQAATGLRIGELLGLRVDDVDLMRRVVHVDHQLGRTGRTMVPTKTEHSMRDVPLARDVALLLSAQIANYPPGKDGVIFSTTFGNAVRHDIHSTMLKDAASEAGLPEGTSSHDLRHWFASVLVAAGLPLNVVAAQLGHKDAALVVSTYSHLLPDAQDVARQAIDAVWEAPVSRAVSRKG